MTMLNASVWTGYADVTESIDCALSTTTESIDRALLTLAAGGMVVVADDDSRENEGDLVMAAEHMTVDAMTLVLRSGSGIVCTRMTGDRADAISLELMVETNTESHNTTFTVTVDHISVHTGISAPDRTATVRALADPVTRSSDLRRPGHVFPLRSRKGGVLKRAGHTEASTDLLNLAGCQGVGVGTAFGSPSAWRRNHLLPRRTSLTCGRNGTDSVTNWTFREASSREGESSDVSSW